MPRSLCKAAFLMFTEVVILTFVDEKTARRKRGRSPVAAEPLKSEGSYILLLFGTKRLLTKVFPVSVISISI